jgi:hypothetical protein
MPEGEPAGDFGVDRNSLKFYARNFKACLLEAQQGGEEKSNDDEYNFLRPNIYQVWCDLIENYTRRDLTGESNRLIAITGLAQAMELVTGDELIAGLWSNALLSQLMWHIDPETIAGNAILSGTSKDLVRLVLKPGGLLPM